MSDGQDTSRDYAHPFRPRAVSLINRWTEAAGLTRPLDAGELIATAHRRTKLSDFGPPPVREPLTRLVESLEMEARLTPVGRAMTRTRLLSALGVRLRAQQLFDTRPEILDREVRPPLFITGLQRSGTTVLSRLLADDPAARSLASWEALDPVPSTPRRAQAELDRGRLRSAKLAETALRYLAPDFFAVHPVQAQSPEEEIMLLDLTFLSTVAEASYHVPSFARWVAQQDQRPAYEYLEKMLKLLQWQRDAAFWVLKSPHHLEWLETVVEVFPGAKIVQTHRDPRATIPSFCSMVSHGRGIFSDEVDPREVADHWLTKIARMLRRASNARERIGPDRFMDVSYDDLLAAPVATLRRVYRHLDRRPPRDVDERVARWLGSNRQHRYGRHRYEAADFGLDESRLRAALGEHLPE